MSAAILALDGQLLDLATWLLAVRTVGIAGESNPIAVVAYGGGVELVLVAKAGAAVLLALLAFRLRRRRWALLPGAVGLVGAATNILAMT